jgi:hypothetical protein
MPRRAPVKRLGEEMTQSTACRQDGFSRRSRSLSDPPSMSSIAMGVPVTSSMAASYVGDDIRMDELHAVRAS